MKITDEGNTEIQKQSAARKEKITHTRSLENELLS